MGILAKDPAMDARPALWRSSQICSVSFYREGDSWLSHRHPGCHLMDTAGGETSGAQSTPSAAPIDLISLFLSGQGSLGPD